MRKVAFAREFITAVFLTLALAAVTAHSAPQAITDISVTVGWRRVTLTWSAPYDAVASTTPSQYEIRVSTYRVLVTTNDWNNNSDSSAYPYRIVFATSTSAGAPETSIVTGLSNTNVTGISYYFAIRSSTDDINLSEMDSTSPRPVGSPQNNPPGLFSPSSPPDGAFVFTSTPALTWAAPSLAPDGADGDAVSRYTIYYATYSAVLYPTITGGTMIDNITQNNYIMPPLSEKTTYYWRVRAYDLDGAQMDSTSASFYRFIVNAVNEPPLAVTPLTPLNTGYISGFQPINFTWTPSYDPDPSWLGNFTYTLMLSTVGPKETAPMSFWAAVSSIPVNNYTFTAPSTYTLTSQTTSYLLENSTYWWYILTIDSGSLSASATYSFRFLVDRLESDPTNFYLIYPVTGTVVYASSPTFTWNPAFDADPGDIVQYEFDLSIDTFSYSALALNYLPTTFTTGPLLENTTYWWRIQAKDRQGSYMWSTAPDTFIVDAIITPPNAFDLNYPLNLSSTSTLKPFFNWTASSTSEPGRTFTYTVQLSTDNFSTYSSSAGLTSLTYQPSSNLLDNKKYWWKVKAVDSRAAETTANQTAYWFVVNTATEPPNAFTLILPANTSTANPAGVIFDWEDAVVLDPLDSIGSYEIRYSTDSSFAVYSSSAGLTVSSFTTFAALSNYSTYYWKVIAYGLSGSTASSQTFVTSATFNLISPPAQAERNPLKSYFDWDDFPGPFTAGITASYEIRISTDSSYSVYYSSAGLSSSSFTALSALQNNATYYWKVRASLSPFYVGADSVTWSSPPGMYFVTSSSFNLLAPLNDATATYLKTSFDWEDFPDPDLSDGISVKYEVQYSPDSSFSVYSSSGGLTVSAFTLSSSLVNDTTYFWRVRATASPVLSDANTDTYCLQPYRRFFTANIAPAPFSISAPADGYIVTAPTVTVSWQAAADAEGDAVTYTVVYSTDPAFSVKTSSSGITSRSLIVSTATLSENLKYFVKIEARDIWSNLTVTSTSSFYVNVVQEPPSPFNLLLPANGSAQIFPVFSWGAVTDPDPLDQVRYDVWYSTNASFVIKNQITGVATTGYSPTAMLLGLNTYYWKVKAYGTSDAQQLFTWSSSTFSFFVSAPTPKAPANFTGALNGTGAAIIFAWSAVTENVDGTAISTLGQYRLYRSRTFAGLEGASSFAYVSSNTLTYTDASFESGDYYYAVRAINTADVPSPLSEIIYINPSASENKKVFYSENREVSVSVPKETYDAMISRVGSVSVTIMRDVTAESAGSIHRVYDVSLKEGAVEVKNFSTPLVIEMSYAGISVQDPEALGVSWHNGIEWTRMDRTLNTASKTIRIKAKHLSRFRIENSQALTEFTIFNWPPKARIITPNGDGSNDSFVLSYANPKNNVFWGKVYTLNGDYVSDIAADTNVSTISWDGKDKSGFTVSPGVYVYQIKVEGAGAKNITGTVVVAR